MNLWTRLLNVLAALASLSGPVLSAEITPDILREVFPGAVRSGPLEGNPPAARVFDGVQGIGYLFFSQDVIGSLGYSGKPIDVAVGLADSGRITGAQLMRHQEPILMLGIKDADLHRFVSSHRGLAIDAPVAVRRTASDPTRPDAISGATVTSLLLSEAILRSARAVARSRRLIPGTVAAGSLDLDAFEPRSWDALRAENAIAEMRLTGADVARRGGDPANVAPEALFIDLFASLVTPAGIGRNVLGDRQFNDLGAGLKDGDQAVLLAANGLFSFKGTNFARSGRFDRIRVVQGARTFILTADGHRRLSTLAAGAPEFREIGVFIITANSGFDAAAPWHLELAVDGRDSSRSPELFSLEYRIPDRFIRRAPEERGDQEGELWTSVWREHTGQIAVAVSALLALTLILILQERLVRHRILFSRLRTGFLVFTLAWIGWYASAQLSVVNVLTFSQALLSGFRWEFFLLQPVVFLLWGFVAVALLFWGRGVFCGWLCPFGSLQDLVHRIGRLARLPSIRLPFVLHERLVALKYVFFLVIFALSLNFTEQALTAAEIEPFKTAVALKFLRPWQFVAYAALLLVAGLFCERAFCRYLCPLGASLAIPARLRLFEWLKRKKQCGTECQICASRCPVQAIHPDGRINPNECVYCMNCQLLYHDDAVCPPLIARRQRREARSGAGGAAAAGTRA